VLCRAEDKVFDANNGVVIFAAAALLLLLLHPRMTQRGGWGINRGHRLCHHHCHRHQQTPLFQETGWQAGALEETGWHAVTNARPSWSLSSKPSCSPPGRCCLLLHLVVVVLCHHHCLPIRLHPSFVDCCVAPMLLPLASHSSPSSSQPL